MFKGSDLYDHVCLPNPHVVLTPKIFISTPLRKLELVSPLQNGIKYLITIEWHEIGINYRLANLLSKQRTEICRKNEILNDQIKNLYRESEQLEQGLLKQYQIDIISV